MAAVVTAEIGRRSTGFDRGKYPIKTKIELAYTFFYKSKNKFLELLDLNYITNTEQKKNIAQQLDFIPVYNQDYQIGLYGPSDHKSIIFLEENKESKKVMLSIFNSEKYILRDYREIKEKIKDSLLFCRLTQRLFKWFPARLKYFCYINKIELERRSPSAWVKENFIRYIILFATPVSAIYYHAVWNTPLKEIDFTTAKFLFWAYIIIFIIEYAIMAQREEFLLQLK